MKKHPPNFAKKLIHWFHKHGRHNLPWQANPNTYRVWVSEIMLQQTQVSTVIPYYERFMARFPDITALADALEDEVLSYWSGLGYYARARNLHKTAQLVTTDYEGKMPNTVEQLEKLPGIGRSTAGAIISFATKKFAVILDGNVKRVLTRYTAFDEPLKKSAPLKKLWEIADQYTPHDNAHHYNQAMMDLGATICTRTKPKCTQCPLNLNCLAYQQKNPNNYPIKAPKKARPIKQSRFLIIQNNNNQILLYKRAANGIWANLWSFPEKTLNDCPLSISIEEKCYSLELKQHLPSFQHQFTHYTLEVHPIHVQLNDTLILDSNQAIWYTLASDPPGGIPSPVAKLLTTMSKFL